MTNSSTIQTVATRLRALRQRLDQISTDCGREPADVLLLAVSKGHSCQAIEQALAAGQRHFGENYWQELEQKIQALDVDGIIWHFIGRVQSRKAKAMAASVDWVHSLTRRKTAAILHQHRPTDMAALNVCIQVSLYGEAQKDGISPDEASVLATEISAYKRLRLRGLMTILPAGLAPTQIRAAYGQLSQLADQLRAAGLNIDTLSMGMSADWEEAVHAGSTIIRLGGTLFGPRPTKPTNDSAANGHDRTTNGLPNPSVPTPAAVSSPVLTPVSSPPPLSPILAAQTTVTKTNDPPTLSAMSSAVPGAETSAVSGAVSGAETSAEFSADQCVSVGAASVGGECVSVGSMPSAVESSVSAPLDNSSAISFANVDVADKRQLPLRTYGRTHGRITRGQKRALTTLGGKYLLAFDGRPLGTSNSFAGAQDLILDLGCGMCDALAAMAARRAHERFIGIDVYEPGIARGCVLAEQAGLDNLRLVHHDMKEVLRDGIKPGSVKEIYVLFPDPWPKRRHQKRRLIQDEFAGLLHRVLRPNGLCCVATDWPEYADHINKVFASRTDFVTTPVTADALQAATATKFHRRGVNLGHPVSCLCWTAI